MNTTGPLSAGTLLFPVLHRGAGVVVVDKTTGIAVEATRDSERSVQSLTGLLPCHRLDVETSGCLVLAETAAAHRALSAAFAEGRVEKTYLAVVQVRDEAALHQGESRVPLGDWRRGRVQIGTGRAAHTRWKPLWIQGARAGLEIRPLTGRTHQIRAHLCAANLSIEGDPTYGGPAAPRLMLHAFRVRLPATALSQPVEATAPAPPGFLSDEA